MAGAGLSRLVGRVTQLAHLVEACDAGANGRGTSICLLGPAGIGKTSLLRDTQQTARGLGMATATTCCWAEGAPPLWPWLDLLEQLDATPQDPVGFASKGLPAFQQIEQGIVGISDRRPVLLEIDDLHNADEATLLLTRYLAGRLSQLPVVLLLSCRPHDTDAEVRRESRLLTDINRSCDTLTLAPLSRNSIAELASSRGHAALTEAGLDALTAASGGIPLHAVAALEAWPPGAGELDLAATLHTRVQARLRTLPGDQAAILARSAILGRVVKIDAAACVCETSAKFVAGAAAAARSADLIRTGRADEIDYGHDLIRLAMAGSLDPAETTSTHAAAAAMYRESSAAGPADVVRAAHHALLAAVRSPADAAIAVQLGRQAARALADGGAPEDAVELLDQTIAVTELGGIVTPRAGLLIQRASAVLLAGRLAAAHDCYDEATIVALAEGDAVAVAEAAAGLGALWVNTVRSPVEQRRVLQIQRAALAQVPVEQESLRIRLRARIAGESMFWEGASAEELFDVLKDSRQFGDPGTHLEVLSVAHNPLLGPDHGSLRLALSAEMLENAARAPGGILPLMALCWRAVDLFLIGDERADRALGALRDAAEAMQSLSVLYIVRVIETMLLIRAGHLVEAEQSAGEAFELGTRAQDADAMSYFGGQMVAIRWFQGREPEMLAMIEKIAGGAHLDVVDHSFEAGIAALAARAGHHDIARRYVSVVKGQGLQTLPRYSTWLMTLATLVEAATILHDHDTVAEAYRLLQPYGHLPVAPSLAVVCFGSVHQWLGVAARYLNEHQQAEQHFRAAIMANLRIGNLPAVAVARADLASTLLLRGPTRARESEARQLMTEALSAAERYGMDRLAERWAENTNQLLRAVHVTLIRDGTAGNGWRLHYAGVAVPIRDLAGVRMMAAMTSAPGQWISASELASGHQGGLPADRQSILDPVARKSLETHVRLLAATIGEARERGDLVGQSIAEEEMTAVAAQLSAATGIGGRARAFNDENERARTSVRKAIIRALAEIEKNNPAAAGHLRDSLETGSQCRYRG